MIILVLICCNETTWLWQRLLFYNVGAKTLGSARLTKRFIAQKLIRALWVYIYGARTPEKWSNAQWLPPSTPQAGLLKRVESCYLTLQGLQLYPALRGEKEFSARIPVLFTPAVPAAASADEMDILRQMLFENGTHLEELSSRISSHHIEAD